MVTAGRTAAKQEVMCPLEQADVSFPMVIPLVFLPVASRGLLLIQPECGSKPRDPATLTQRRRLSGPKLNTFDIAIPARGAIVFDLVPAERNII